MTALKEIMKKYHLSRRKARTLRHHAEMIRKRLHKISRKN